MNDGRMNAPEIKAVNERAKKAGFVPKGTAQQSRMRRFVFDRTEDVSGTSGTGIVAEGVMFSAGHVSLTWLSPLWTVSSYQSMEAMPTIHGHSGKTRVRWIDE